MRRCFGRAVAPGFPAGIALRLRLRTRGLLRRAGPCRWVIGLAGITGLPLAPIVALVVLALVALASALRRLALHRSQTCLAVGGRILHPGSLPQRLVVSGDGLPVLALACTRDRIASDRERVWK